MANTNSRIEPGPNFDKFYDIPVNVWSTANDIAFDLRMTTFEEMQLPHQLARNIPTSYEVPLPIQQLAIPYILDTDTLNQRNRDIMGWSPTGSGKTAAFVIPLLKLIIESGMLNVPIPTNPARPLALVVLPTRELALQVADDFKKFSQVMVIFGGRNDKNQQKQQLKKGCHILIATPGRLLDYINEDLVTMSKCKFFVLDETDRMLVMGFKKPILRIVERGGMPNKTVRQTLMFSATFPKQVQKAANQFLKNTYVHISVGTVGTANGDIKQELVLADRNKLNTLIDVLNTELANGFNEDTEKWAKKILIFVERKMDANQLKGVLIKRGKIVAVTVNGDRSQTARENELRQFTEGECPVLVATSAAARGLDINGVDLVINYHLPSGVDSWGIHYLTVEQRIDWYVQRIGRTGRAGHPGRALAFYDPDRMSSWDFEIGQKLRRCFEISGQHIPPWFLAAIGERGFLDE